MAIPTIVTFHYALRDKDGNEIDNSAGKDPISVMLGRGHIVRGLDKLLPTMEKGDKKTVVIPPADGYGVVDESLRLKVPRDQFPPDVHIYTTSKQPWVILPAADRRVDQFYEFAKTWSPASLERLAKIEASAGIKIS